MLLTVKRQHLHIACSNPREVFILKQFGNKRFSLYEPPTNKTRWDPVVKYRFFVFNEMDNSFIFDVNVLEDVKKHVTENLLTYNITHESLPVYPKLDWLMHTTKVPRPVQEKAIAFAADPKIHRALIGMQPGTGKTLTCNFVINAIGERVHICVRPKYMAKWVMDVNEYFALDKDDVLLVNGGDQLRGLLRLGLEGKLKAKVIISSNTTMQKYVESFASSPEAFAEDEIYPVTPDKFHEVIQAGLLVVDEVHQNYHFNYRLITITNPNKAVTLSGTYRFQDPVVKRLMRSLFTENLRYDGEGLIQWAVVHPIAYTVSNPKLLKHRTYGNNNYNHIEYEKSILRHRKLADGYLRLVKILLTLFYFKGKERGDKALIFVASIELATQMTAYFKKEYPTMDIRRYVESDPYCNVLEADICVSTVLSAGTAVDVPGLTTAIMTTSLSTEAGNLQALHRTRDIPGRIVRFVYLYCKQINKQVDYDRAKRILFKDYAKSIIPHQFPEHIDTAR